MGDLRKAAEMALEALEKLRFANAPFLDEATKALRQALAQQEQEPVGWLNANEGVDAYAFTWRKKETHDIPLYAAPVDAVNMTQERVDEMTKREHDRAVELAQAYERGWNAALAQQEQEPVGYAYKPDLDMPHHDFWVNREQGVNEVPLYTAPPKREWVGLTRLELDIATLGLEDLGDCYAAIEAKLKEKNGG